MFLSSAKLTLVTKILHFTPNLFVLDVFIIPCIGFLTTVSKFSIIY